MKKLICALLCAAVFGLGGCDEEKTANSIYVFSQPGCGHCEHAHAYMERYYKDYDIKEINIRKGNNISHLMRYARKFNVPTETLGTPFIVMGEHYIMGWGTEQQKQFNRQAKAYQPKNAKQN